MGRHSAPDEDGDLLVVEPVRADTRVDARARHAVADAELVRTDVIEPEVVERPASSEPRDVVDAVVVEDERYPVRSVGPGLAVAPDPAGPEPATDAADSAAPPVAPERGSRVDLRLLRENSSLRARCLAALLLPFILYTIAMVVIGRVDVYLLWLWIPAILAGILFGAQLDGAVKRSARTVDPEPHPDANAELDPGSDADTKPGAER